MNGILNGYIEQARPYFVEAQRGFGAYMERLIGRLDILADILTEDHPVVRHKYWVNLNGADTYDLADPPVEVPMGHQWILEVMNASEVGQFDEIQLRANTLPVITLNPASGGFGTPSLGSSLPVHLSGGVTIDLVAGAGAAATVVYLQFRDVTPKVRRRTRSAGQIERAPETHVSASPARENLAAHSTPGIFEGRNIHGERHG